MGFDIDGGVFPTFVFCTAHGANPTAGFGGKGFIDCTAGRTDLGGGDEAPYLQKLLALPVQLVTQHLAEHSKAGVVDVASAQFLRDRLKRIVPNAHGIPGFGYPPGFLVQEVASLVGDVLVKQTVFCTISR